MKSVLHANNILRFYETFLRTFTPLIYSEINAVSIGLPRYTKSYQTKPWAYIAFKSEEAMQAAMEISCSFNGRNLIWTTPDLAKNLCIRCSSPDHKIGRASC